VPEAQDYALRAVIDVVRRYDIDAVHFDDYFYPYSEKDRRGRAIAFPDDASYARYQRGGGTMARDDWRRDNVNRFVRRTYESIKAEKPQVKFGISPFGIWKSGMPAGVRGMTAYQELYADSRLWLAQGWVDYFAPQLYWAIGAPEQSFTALLAWWAGQNAKGRHLWPGLYTSRTGDGTKKGYSRTEIANQIAATRQQAGVDGAIHFSAKAIMTNQGGIADTLLSGPYAQPALVPPCQWLPARAGGGGGAGSAAGKPPEKQGLLRRLSHRE
jgi:uncharacterized lipoprotein YddW (UPF0748 family)